MDGKGFDEFTKNPYWRGYYENAPSDAAKDYIRCGFELNYAGEHGLDDSKIIGEIGKIKNRITKNDVQYFYDNAQFGMKKSAYKKWLEKFD